MADRRQLRSGLGARLVDAGAVEVSLELVVVEDGAVFDIDELLLSLGIVVLEVDELGVVVLGVVVDGLVAGVEVVLASAGRVVASFVDCA